MKYQDARAFRAALEDRLKQRSRETGRPLDRLRKEAASQRLLARLVILAPEDSWALKGGLALIARLGEHARGTKDADATWRASQDELAEAIDRAMSLDTGDHFTFEIGRPSEITAEGPEGGLRFPVVARLAGREFERLLLDVNLVPDDPRGVERALLRNLFDFAGFDAVEVPIVSPAQQLAEKIHAYTRDYGQQSSRTKDLYDMLVIADQLTLPSAADLVAACVETFDLRETAWAPELRPPPDSWASAWTGFVETYGSRWPRLADAYGALEAFWVPLLAGEIAEATWDADAWSWEVQ